MVEGIDIIKVPETLNVQKTVFDNRYINAISLTDEELIDLSVKARVDAMKPQREMAYMTYPIYLEADELYGVIQCIPNFKKDTKRARGFTNADEVMLKVVASFL